MTDHEWGFRTRALHAGARPDPTTGARAVPIFQTSSYVFKDTADAADLFALQKYGMIYSRLGNPTVSAFEERMASLDGALGAVAASSGHAAEFLAIATLAEAGDHIVSSSHLYGAPSRCSPTRSDASANPSRASNFVATYLLSTAKAYTLYLVNPRETEILGQPVYPSLQDLSEVPDMVDVFRRSEDLPPIAQEAVKLGSKTFWAQLGLWSAEAAQIASAAGLDGVRDRCTKSEHARFAGGLHLAGFNTGVITARR